MQFDSGKFLKGLVKDYGMVDKLIRDLNEGKVIDPIFYNTINLRIRLKKICDIEIPDQCPTLLVTHKVRYMQYVNVVDKSQKYYKGNIIQIKPEVIAAIKNFTFTKGSYKDSGMEKETLPANIHLHDVSVNLNLYDTIDENDLSLHYGDIIPVTDPEEIMDAFHVRQILDR